ncbi:MAG: flavodoxin family protein [Fusobacteriaceae bacterium]|jgi:hypothetical protein|nr:flavodoxin family protein [Fusobacteriaceae bacterium]
MNLVIHDLDARSLKAMVPDLKADRVIGPDKNIRHCVGCYGCWIKTPGKCVLSDAHNDMAQLLGQSERVTIVSRCVYGSYSPFVKTILERSIPYLHPCFTVKNGLMRHKDRYEKKFILDVVFYGEGISAEEEETARELVAANASNMGATLGELRFTGNSPAKEREAQ